MKIARVTIPAITAAIQAFRDHKVIIIPGGGGKYGTIELPTEEQVIPRISRSEKFTNQSA